MAKIKEYSNATAFRIALENRIRAIATKERADLGRLRRQVVYDRLLARLFTDSPPPWVLKGGYAMQLRLPSARGTKDIDLAMRDNKLLSGDPKKQNDAIGEILQKKAKLPMGDFFEFIITGPIKDLNAAPYGGARFHIEARLADRTFEKFHLDIGIGDVWIEPLDNLASRAWLDFAGIVGQSFPVISKEQQFAEKIHAYTLPRKVGTTNSRVKDLIDMVLLIATDSLDVKRLSSAIHATFDRRKTHAPSTDILPPPETWLIPYTALAKECEITLDMAAAYKTLQNFLKTLSL